MRPPVTTVRSLIAARRGAAPAVVGVLVAGVLAAGAAGCGDSDASRAAERPTSRVRVTVDRDGSGGARAKTAILRCPSASHPAACRRLRTLPPAIFSPVPADRACTQIYGGPQIARIIGTIEDRAVAGEFDRRNGCGIHRWKLVAPVLAVVR